MKVTRLSIAKFRNLSDVFCEPSCNVNVIYGENGQGKTNMLEAIWLFSGSKSFRGAAVSELIPIGEEKAEFSICYNDLQRENQTKIVLGDKKEIKQNNVFLNSFSELSRSFCCIVFSPIHLNLIKGGPSERRKSIDTVIGQIKPRYTAIINEYQRMLLQRNTLLKDIQFSSSLLDTLDIWDQSLSRVGSLISKTRKSFVDKLFPLSQEFYRGISANREAFDMKYFSTIEEDGEISEKTMLFNLNKNRSDDIKNGSTSVGPQRDDIIFDINGISARSFGSQGQQRSAVLAMKLGECALMEKIIGESPVILFDDVMSELDDSRRDFLLHRLSDRQIFITCCDPNQIADISAKFEISKGKII